MARGIIYLILNKQTEHKYIGSTLLPMNKEWVQHIDRSKRMSYEPIHRAFRQYGTHNFLIRELEDCDEKDLEFKLREWKIKYNPEYNPILNIEEEEEEEIIPEYKPPTKREYRSSPHLQPWNENTRGNGKHFGLKIRGKNLVTGICTDYESARVAAQEVTGNPKNNSNILLAARTGRKAYGHKWQLLEDRPKKKAVFGVNKKTEQIQDRFESMAAALRAYESEDKPGLIKSLKNPGRYSWKGQWWFYTKN